MFLLILESIGTSELILIAVVALIVFGPRKLPQMAKTIGKTMAEFKNATNEFKSTWEREAQFETEDKTINPNTNLLTDTVAVEKQVIAEPASISAEKNFLEPTVKELSSEEAAKLFPNKLGETEQKEISTQPAPAKRDWL